MYLSLIIQLLDVFRVCIVVCTGHFWQHIRYYMQYGKVQFSTISWRLCSAKVRVTHRVCSWPVLCCGI